MRIIILSTILLAAASALAPATSQGQDPDDNLVPFMRAKLQHTQKAMEGLALEDHDLISKSAQELTLISQASNWQVLQTAEYRRQSTEFRRSAEALKTAAEKKNLDGAVLAYVDLTMKCVQCHKYVRSVRAAALELPGFSTPVAK